MADAHPPAPGPATQPPGRRHVDWAAAERVEAEHRARVQRERRIGRRILMAGLATLVLGAALLLAAGGAVEIAGIVLAAFGAGMAVHGNRRLLRTERFRVSGLTNPPSAPLVGPGFGPNG
jgi:hypothetical protein